MQVRRKEGIGMAGETKSAKSKRTQEILDLLDMHYGTEYVCYLNHENAWQLLIATMLSAQCTDARVNIVTKDLFVKYPNVQAFADADLKELDPGFAFYIHGWHRPLSIYRGGTKYGLPLYIFKGNSINSLICFLVFTSLTSIIHTPLSYAEPFRKMLSRNSARRSGLSRDSASSSEMLSAMSVTFIVVLLILVPLICLAFKMR